MGFKVYQSYYYFVKDASGSVRSVLRAEQSSVQTSLAVSEVARYDYDAWGNATATNLKNAQIDGVDVADFNPIRWKSQYFDAESGFYYIGGRYYSPETKRYVDAGAPETALANALTIYDINPYNLCLTNPLSVIYNNYTIKTQTELTYDPPKLTKWQAFWRSSWGKGIAAVLFFAATMLALECSLAFPALAGGVWASYGAAFGLTAATLGVGAGIAGYRSARQGKGFWNGFAEHVHNNWSQEVAIASTIFIVSLGITVTKFAIENAVSKKALSEYTKKYIVGTDHNILKPTQDYVYRSQVDYYVQQLNSGSVLPNIEVYEVPGKGLFIQDGHHRYVASMITGKSINITYLKVGGPIGMNNWMEVNWLP